jgi:hypothetical protein
MLKKIVILMIKLILVFIVFFALMSLFVTILKTGLLRENSFAIKFLLAFPLAIVWGLLSVIILFRFEPTTSSISQTKKIRNINMVKCQARENN